MPSDLCSVATQKLISDSISLEKQLSTWNLFLLSKELELPVEVSGITSLLKLGPVSSLYPFKQSICFGKPLKSNLNRKLSQVSSLGCYTSVCGRLYHSLDVFLHTLCCVVLYVISVNHWTKVPVWKIGTKTMFSSHPSFRQYLLKPSAPILCLHS